MGHRTTWRWSPPFQGGDNGFETRMPYQICLRSSVDRAARYERVGQGFESSRGLHKCRCGVMGARLIVDQLEKARILSSVPAAGIAQW